jgi:hypothetical protein
MATDAPLTSQEKIALFAEELENAPPDDDLGPMAQLVGMSLPFVVDHLPADPRELDEQLDQVATFILGLKSDPAALPSIAT